MSDLLEENKNRLKNKIKKEPELAIGLGGLTAAIAYSIFHFRKRDRTIPLSVYVIQTRVIAQGLVVGALTAGLVYHMYKSYKNPSVIPILSQSVTQSEIEKIKKI